jgi:recombinational DNA repair protein (RecF pathway)
MKLVCANCEEPIDPEGVDMAGDTAVCRRCGRTYRVSDLVGAPDGAHAESAAEPEADLDHPP